MLARAAMLAGLLGLVVGHVAGQGRAGPFVPVGVWYGGGTARPPMASRNPAAERDRWRADLQAIRGLGFNSIRTWVDWAGAEPERGRYRFDALDQMLELAQEAGLKVLVQLYPDAAPHWIGQRYPDARLVSASGQPVAAASGYCLDHPAAREDMAAFVWAASERASRHESFHAIDLWAEPGASRWTMPAAGPEVCFCPQTERRFREWLRRRYGTIEALNASWYRSFAAWEDVDAPRVASRVSHADLIDWNAFLAVKLQEDLRFMAGSSAPRGARTTSGHGAAPAVLVSPLSGPGLPDDWLMSTAVDQYGAAIRPAGADAMPWSPVRLAAALDSIRSAGRDRGWWVGSLQAGQGAAGVRVGPPVTPDDVRLWSWAALSRGARAISYYAWYPVASGFESNGYGMNDLDGTISDRARAAGVLAGIVSRNPALFAPLRPRPSSVAIVYNRLSYLAGGGGDEVDRAVADSMLGFYRAMFARNIQVDFVHADEVAAGRAADYRAVFLAHPLILPRAVADALKAFVHAGGTLISEARPGWSDERGHASPRIPGLGLDEVFGVRERAVEQADRVDMVAERELDGPLSPLAGKTIMGTGLAERLEITGPSVRVVARFAGSGGAPGNPAVVISRYGSGRAALVGSLAAAAFERDPDQARLAGDLLAALTAGAGVSPEIRITGGAGSVEARYLESSAATVIVAINHANAPQKVTLTFSPDTPEAIWLNLETGTSVNFVDGPDGPFHAHAFRPRDVLVLMIKRDLR